MHCSICLRELAGDTVRCPCGGAVSQTTESAWLVHQGDPQVALVEVIPMTPEARLASTVARGFRRIVGSPQLARPLQLTKLYWPVAVIPTTVGIVLGAGVKTSLAFVGSALYWGVMVAMQLLGNM